MIRRLIRWLARREIDQAFESGAIFGKAIAVKHSEAQRMIGRVEGVAEAMKCFERAVRESYGEEVSGDDVERVRKGMLH